MSGIRRFFVDSIHEGMKLEGEEFAHACSVLRLKAGDEIILLDNSGKEYGAIIAKVNKRDMDLTVTGESIGDKESKTDVCLIVGLLKGDKTELVVQKATELGVKEIKIFTSKYVSAYVNDNKLERLEKVAKEAAKQCLRSVAPAVEYFPTLEEALKSAKDYENKLFACEFAQESEVELKDISGSTAVVVGSEGGFAKEEFEMAKELGYKGITLGKRILRAETAAITMVSLVTFILGDLS